MIKNLFDVLIVYSDRIAYSANSPNNIKHPFKIGSDNESYNDVYSYFLSSCQLRNIKCAFTTSKDVIGAGKCKSYSTFKDKNWTKVNKEINTTLVFDKFSPVSSRIRKIRSLLFSDRKIRSFNSPYLFALFFDKFKTYQKLEHFCIPAVRVNSKDKKSISRAIKNLNTLTTNHPLKNDFSQDIVMKDRYGAGGKRVYKFAKNDYKNIIEKAGKSKKSFLLQPLINFNKGYEHEGVSASTDVRFVFLDGKIVQTYLRIAKKGEFRCNEHKGGKLIYVKKSDIPKKITALSNNIAKVLGDRKSLYSLDFIVSNRGNVYFLEGNTGPGLDWNVKVKKNEVKAKELINLIVNKFVKLAKRKTLINKNKSFEIPGIIPNFQSPQKPIYI